MLHPESGRDLVKTIQSRAFSGKRPKASYRSRTIKRGTRMRSNLSAMAGMPETLESQINLLLVLPPRCSMTILDLLRTAASPK